MAGAKISSYSFGLGLSSLRERFLFSVWFCGVGFLMCLSMCIPTHVAFQMETPVSTTYSLQFEGLYIFNCYLSSHLNALGARTWPVLTIFLVMVQWKITIVLVPSCYCGLIYHTEQVLLTSGASLGLRWSLLSTFIFDTATWWRNSCLKIVLCSH